MMRWLILLYGLFAYVIGFASLILFMLFLGDWSFVPWRINRVADTSPAVAIFANAMLMLLFGVTHSVMARPWFKRWWTRLVPPAAERSTYVLVAGLTLVALCVLWRPLPGSLWQIDNHVIAAYVRYRF